MPPESAPLEKEGKDLYSLSQLFRDRVTGSRLNEEEKRATLTWLATNPEAKNTDNISMRITHLPVAERSSQKIIAEYEKKIAAASAAGLLAKKSAEQYKAWFASLSFADKNKYLAQSDLDKPERKAIFEEYKRLPAAVRHELKDKFFNANLEERRRIVAENSKKHESIKTAFLRMPKDVQGKYRDQFKSLGLADREKLLKAIGVAGVRSEGGKTREQAESEHLMEAFTQKMETLAAQNLFSSLSIPAYEEWYEALPIEQKRAMLKHSDLDNPQRAEKRDEFYALPAETRAPFDLKFRNADLDGRKAIIAQITGAKSEKNNNYQLYSETAMRTVLKNTLESPELKNSRLIYTIADRSGTLRRRAELRYNAKKTKDLMKNAAGHGNTENGEQMLFMNTIEHHGEARHWWRRFLVGKLEQGEMANAPNIKLVDANKQEIGARQFKEEIVEHRKSELMAALISRVSAKLPGADPSKLKSAARMLNLHTDLLKAVA